MRMPSQSGPIAAEGQVTDTVTKMLLKEVYELRNRSSHCGAQSVAVTAELLYKKHVQECAFRRRIKRRKAPIIV